jgi:hypothetical protein
MIQEHKELLFKDLCARLPYGVKAYVKNWSKLDRKWYEGVYTVESIHPSLNNILVYSERGSVEVIVGYDDYDIKPYLFPMSEMTEEQEKEWRYTLSSDGNITYETVDWLNKNHFDYRGLIEKGLAIDASFHNVY